MEGWECQEQGSATGDGKVGFKMAQTWGSEVEGRAQCEWVEVGGISGLSSPSKSPVSSLTGSDANLTPQETLETTELLHSEPLTRSSFPETSVCLCEIPTRLIMAPSTLSQHNELLVTTYYNLMINLSIWLFVSCVSSVRQYTFRESILCVDIYTSIISAWS